MTEALRQLRQFPDADTLRRRAKLCRQKAATIENARLSSAFRDLAEACEVAAALMERQEQTMH